MLAQLVLNENSRRGRESASLVRQTLRESGITVVEAADGEPVAGVDALIAGGGDGTIIRTAADAIERKLPLGIVPLGTFNELARTLGIPLDIVEACRVIAEAHPRTIDVGRVNGTYFVNEASIGISSRIARLQTPELKQRFGFLGVIGTALQAFRHARPMHVVVEYGGTTERLRTLQLTVANSHRFGGIVNVADASIDDGVFDLYSVDIKNFWDAVSISRAMLAGTADSPAVRRFRADRFTIRTHHPHRIAADGEPAGETPAVFQLLHDALRVFAPEDSKASSSPAT